MREDKTQYGVLHEHRRHDDGNRRHIRRYAQPQEEVEQDDVEHIVDRMTSGEACELAPGRPGAKGEDAREPEVCEKACNVGHGVGHVHLHRAPQQQAVEPVVQCGGRDAHDAETDETALNKRGEAR